MSLESVESFFVGKMKETPFEEFCGYFSVREVAKETKQHICHTRLYIKKLQEKSALVEHPFMKPKKFRLSKDYYKEIYMLK